MSSIGPNTNTKPVTLSSSLGVNSASSHSKKIDDKKVALTLVTENCFLLNDLPDELKNDKDVVVAAVKRLGTVLKMPQWI